MKLGLGSMGRWVDPYKIEEWVNWVQGLHLSFIEIKLLTSELWTVRPIKQSFLKCYPVQELERHSA